MMRTRTRLLALAFAGVLLGIPWCLRAADDVKQADLAGTWYPADAGELKASLQGYIDSAYPAPAQGRIYGAISPHAGYLFSGRTAGFTFKAIRDIPCKTIVIIGFSHRQFFDGISIYDRGVFRTPLGEIRVDTVLAKKLISQSKISFYPKLFQEENSVEMLIPFIQVAKKDVMIVPVAFGLQDYQLCETLANSLASVIKGRDDVLVIASTDLSHYHTYEEALRIDDGTIRKIEAFDAKGLFDAGQLGTSECCGLAPVAALMLTMKALGATGVKVLKHENSGDVTGDKTRVVGYASVVFYKPEAGPSDAPATSAAQQPVEQKGEAQMLSEKQRKRLLEIARTTMEGYITAGKAPEFTETDPELVKVKGAFVTLNYKGELRGCIGNIIGQGPLFRTVRDMAIESSTSDPRFPPVTAKELKDIHIEISVLTEPQRITDVNAIIMGKHGVIVRRGFSSGVFLPQVATETGWGREEFLNNLCAHKAGLPADAWKDPRTEIYIFSAEVFGE